MPALYTLWNTRFQKRWNVGSDDFVLPTIVAISVRLVGFVLVVGVLIYLYVAPLRCEDDTFHTPPWLYGTLFAILLLEFAVVINDAIIMSKSCLGRIDHSEDETQGQDQELVAMPRLDGSGDVAIDLEGNKTKRSDPDSNSPRRPIKRYLLSRILLFLLEIILSVLYGYACWSPSVTEQVLECDAFQGPVYFARAVAVTWWITIIVSCVGWLIYLDPVGICSPGLIDQMEFLDEIHDTTDTNEHNLIKHYSASIGSKRIRRRLQTLCCCLGRHQSRSVALEDAARVMHTLFDDVDVVASDVAAGLILLNRDQKVKKHIKKECLVSKFRELTFQKMDDQFIPDCYDNKGNCSKQYHHIPFDKLSEPGDKRETGPKPDGYLLLDDLLHYCHYAAGMYGYPLYIYGRPLTGCCRLTAQTCFKCYCWRLAPRRESDEIAHDNFCFCGFASVQLQSPDRSLGKADIEHITFKNDLYECPYLLCVDHAMQSIVVCVRGTLSFKDVLTDITVSVKKLEKADIGFEGAYVHGGMYKSAIKIKEQLLNETKPILRKACKENNGYRLVIVGHSLGAGVASVLTILLRKQFPDVICYAFSPPGCTLSFPLAVYSREFITSVVIGNDIVPRLSIRALHYMKREIEYLLKRCHKPKHQVMFQPRVCDPFCRRMCEDDKDEPTVCIDDFGHRLFEDYDENTDNETKILPLKQRQNTGDNILSWGCCGSKDINSSDGDVHKLVKKVTDRERVPIFPPGEILHITVDPGSKSCCWPNWNPPKLDVKWIKGEDLGVILADRGMFEDHMPTHVISTLRAYHKEVSSRNKEQLTNERVEQTRKGRMYNEIRNLIDKRNIQLERGTIEADSTGSDEVDGGDTGEEVNVTEEVEGVDSREEVDGSQEANGIHGLDLADGTEEAGVIVFEGCGEERNILVKMKET